MRNGERASAPQRDPAGLELLAEHHAEGLEGPFEEPLVLSLARLEPGPIVVGAELEQEAHRIGREAFECRGHRAISSGGKATRRRDAGLLRPLLRRAHRAEGPQHEQVVDDLQSPADDEGQAGKRDALDEGRGERR